MNGCRLERVEGVHGAEMNGSVGRRLELVCRLLSFCWLLAAVLFLASAEGEEIRRATRGLRLKK